MAKKHLPWMQIAVWPVLLIIFSGIAFSCNHTTSADAGSMQIKKIEIDVFSGRPNPAWVPNTADAAILMAHISFDTVTDCGPLPDGLGYKGFIVTLNDSTTGTQQWRVYSGKLWLNNPVKCYKDIHQLENLLVQQAKNNGFDQLIRDLHL